jgi:hypothetical protein
MVTDPWKGLCEELVAAGKLDPSELTIDSTPLSSGPAAPGGRSTMLETEITYANQDEYLSTDELEGDKRIANSHSIEMEVSLDEKKAQLLDYLS